jgi:hypothetical protein
MGVSEEGLPSGGELHLPAPLNFSGLIASSWRAYRSIFGRLLIIGFVLFGIADLIEIAVLTLTPIKNATTISSSLRFLFSLSMYVFLGSLVVALASIGVADVTAGLRVTVGSMWGGVRSALKEVVASNLLAVVIGLTLVVLLAAFPFLFLPLFFGPPLVIHVVTLERKRLPEAMPRVRELARGSWAKTILYLLCVAIGARLLQGAVLDGLWIATNPFAATEVLRGTLFVLGRVLVEAATAGFFGVVATFVYFDLRARKEDYGPDELRAERTAM